MHPQSTPAPAVVYRDVAGFPGYRVGDDGSVWSRRLAIRGERMGDDWHRLNPVPRRGYPRVGLWRDSKLHWRSVHALVLNAFIGPRPEGMECCHEDGDKTNNRLSNIRWDTPSGNASDSLRLGRIARGSRSPSAKLTEADIPPIKAAVAGGESQRSVGRRLGVSHNVIGRIVNGKGWLHVP